MERIDWAGRKKLSEELWNLGDKLGFISPKILSAKPVAK
jgi:hypothetical protein